MTCLYPGPSELYKQIHSSSSGVTAISACLFFFLQYHPALSDRVCDRPQGAICIGIATGVGLQSGLSRNTSANFSPHSLIRKRLIVTLLMVAYWCRGCSDNFRQPQVQRRKAHVQPPAACCQKPKNCTSVLS